MGFLEAKHELVLLHSVRDATSRSALADGHDAHCGSFAAVVLGVGRDDHRRGTDYHHDNLKPDRYTLTCPRTHPATLNR